MSGLCDQVLRLCERKRLFEDSNITKYITGGNEKTHNLGGCIITKSLDDGTSKLKWIFREESVNPVDNGWRAFGDTDTEEYINVPENNLVVDFDRLVEIEPAVLAIYDMPVGTDMEFDSQRKVFIDSNTGKEYR